MAAIVNGASSTLKEDELSPRLLEAFFLLENQAKEQEENNVTITTNFNTKIASVNFSFTVNPIIDATGNIIYSTQNYIDDFGFDPGENSDIKGDTLVQNIFEMINLVSIYEKDNARNPQSLSKLTANFNYANSTFTGTMSFDITTNLTATGKAELTATEYLL